MINEQIGRLLPTDLPQPSNTDQPNNALGRTQIPLFESQRTSKDFSQLELELLEEQNNRLKQLLMQSPRWPQQITQQDLSYKNKVLQNENQQYKVHIKNLQKQLNQSNKNQKTYFGKRVQCSPKQRTILINQIREKDRLINQLKSKLINIQQQTTYRQQESKKKLQQLDQQLKGIRKYSLNYSLNGYQSPTGHSQQQYKLQQQKINLLMSQIQYLKAILKQKDKDSLQLTIHQLKAQNAILRKQINQYKHQQFNSNIQPKMMQTLRSDISFKFSQLQSLSASPDNTRQQIFRKQLQQQIYKRWGQQRQRLQQQKLRQKLQKEEIKNQRDSLLQIMKQLKVRYEKVQLDKIKIKEEYQKQNSLILTQKTQLINKAQQLQQKIKTIYYQYNLLSQKQDHSTQLLAIKNNQLNKANQQIHQLRTLLIQKQSIISSNHNHSLISLFKHQITLLQKLKTQQQILYQQPFALNQSKLVQSRQYSQSNQSSVAIQQSSRNHMNLKKQAFSSLQQAYQQLLLTTENIK